MIKLHIDEYNNFQSFSWYDYNIPDERSLPSGTESNDKYLRGVLNKCSICKQRRFITNKDNVCSSCIKYDTPHRRMFRRVKGDAVKIMRAMDKQKGCCSLCKSSLVRYSLMGSSLVCEDCCNIELY